ncbi:MAG: hypothetical protein D6758_03845 [Gammaproteobacteria bacterium]|nr:MAG: hypothetical protein D6758_03845 [Gammaproteobacteria bacterium]
MGRRSLLLRIAVLAATALPLLLLDIGPGHADSRLYHTFWDLGHPLVFGLLAWILLPLGIVRALILSVLAAAGVEGMQGLTGRTPSASDVLYSLAGALLVAGAVARVRAWRVGAFVVAAVALLPLGRNLVDEIWMRVQFPVLIGAPDELSASRWRQPPRTDVVAGQPAWWVRLQSRYDGVWLRHLVADWEGYDALAIHLQASAPVTLTVRVDDRTHWLGGQVWGDRYNHTRVVPAGDQTLRIPLADIRRSPATRELNLSEVQSVYLFVPSDLPQPVSLRILGIELVKE